MIDREADEPFTEPWQARAFAMAVVAAERMGQVAPTLIAGADEISHFLGFLG